MKPVLFAVAGAAVSVLAFPPFGPGVLILPGITLFLIALRWCDSRSQGLWVGAVYGLVFFGGLMWWLAELELLALILVPVQALFPALYGWWLAGKAERDSVHWVPLAVGGWAVMELVRYHFPVGGQEWGGAGYALSDNLYTRLPAAAVGTSGLTLLVVLLAAMAAVALTGRWDHRLGWAALVPLAAVVAALPSIGTRFDAGPVPVAIVQGSTPCPFEHCPPNERLRTFEKHLELSETIEPGSVDLVVWPESSTGSSNADPVLNDEIRTAIGEQARRIGAAILVGGDRSVGDDEFINANVFFDAEGVIVGEYRKQHAVPFGEYIPARPLFDWIPALDRVPRDMVPGDGPVVFEAEPIELGSVISWEGGFSRYALQHRRAGANVLAVTTNTASYGADAPTSDQFMGMTRMRAVELGVPVVHAAVTGKSTVIDHQGSFGETTEAGESVIFYGDVGQSTWTIFSTIGDAILYLGVALALFMGWHSRTLVGSRGERNEEDPTDVAGSREPAP